VRHDFGDASIFFQAHLVPRYCRMAQKGMGWSVLDLLVSFNKLFGSFKDSLLSLDACICIQIADAAPKTPLYYYHFHEMTGVTVDPHQLILAIEDVGVPTFRGFKFTNYNLWQVQLCTQPFAFFFIATMVYACVIVCFVCINNCPDFCCCFYETPPSSPIASRMATVATTCCTAATMPCWVAWFVVAISPCHPPCECRSPPIFVLS
jgi:hypothetical protein